MGPNLAYWQPDKPSTLHIFETKHWMPVRETMVEEVDLRGEDAGLLWGLYSLTPVVWSAYAGGPRSLLLAFEQAGNGVLPRKEIVKIQSGSCLPAFSEDGAFAAVPDKDNRHVHILDSASGACFFSAVVCGAAAEFVRHLSLAWAGRRLLVK